MSNTALLPQEVNVTHYQMTTSPLHEDTIGCNLAGALGCCTALPDRLAVVPFCILADGNLPMVTDA